MTPTRLTQCMDALGLDQEGLARLLDYDVRSVRRWASGAGAIPRVIAILLELMTQGGYSAATIERLADTNKLVRLKRHPPAMPRRRGHA